MTDFANDPDYEVCLVTFFDVLGFRNLLNTRSGAEIRQLLSTFRRVSDGDATRPIRSDEMRMISEVHAEIVSDAIVRTRTIETQYPTGPLVWELIDLLHIQIECVSSGIMVRGAMTIGPMHLGIGFDGPVFGPGLVQAFFMEEREVIFPRIAVHEDVIERHREDSSLWREGHSYEDEQRHLASLLCLDDSGLHFIDYLRASLGEIDDEFSGWIEFLSRHKTLIETGLAEENAANVRRKYVWLKNYHNKVVNEKLDRAEPEAVSAAEELALQALRELRIPERASVVDS